MANYLNPGNKSFGICAKARIYVDKTGLISFTNDRIYQPDRFICVARPRRFGKSYAADMLTAYYSRGCDSRALFENTKIARDPSFEEHLNKYNVIYLDISNILDSGYDKRTVTEAIKWVKTAISDELGKEYPDVARGEDFIGYLNDVYSETGVPFVVIIDEWDSIIREEKDDKDGQEEYLRFLRTFLKGKTCVALAYMTGILPMKMNGTQSEANMFKEVSMTSPKPLQEYFGFTEDEVRELCAERGCSFDGMRDWYDGYDVGGISIYNPNSVVNSLLDGEFKSYWTHTETYEDLKTYIKTNKYGVQDVLVDLLAGKEVEVNPDGFANDTVTFDGRDDVLTLLIHLGYLTYDSRTKKARIPNREIREEFIDVIENAGLGNYNRTRLDSEKVFEATLKGDEDTVAKYVKKIHRMRASKLEYNKEISLKFAIEFAYIAAEGLYSLVLEMPAGDGFADVGYIPMNCNDPSYPPMIVELKVNKSAEGALGQALDSEYFDFLSAYHGEVILVGINYDTDTKEHTCKIQRVVKE